MYLYRIYVIEEYEVDAETRKEAKEKIDHGEYEERSQWEEKTTLRKEK